MLCFAIDCNHKNGRNPCSFFRFPNDKRKNSLWTKMSRRSDRNPTPNDRLCSCHFVNGKKLNGPSIFSYNKSKTFQYASPEKKRKLNSSSNGEKSANEVKNDKNVDEHASLRAEIYFLKKEVSDLKEKLNKRNETFPFSSICENDQYVSMYTGLPNASVFYLLFHYIERFDFEYKFGWKVENITLQDQLFITLQKLRQNYTFADLAVRYSVSETTIRNIFHTLVSAIHESLFEAIIVAKQVPSLEKIKKTLSEETYFENCRFLLDSTEIFIENPRGDLDAQRQTYSNYKKRQTFKGLLAVAPNGVICFLSQLYPGSISDKMLFKQSGILKILKPGDLLLADKGFLIHDLLPQGVSVNVPPFLYNNQFTKQEAKFTTKLARKRIHAERAFQRIKIFEILDLIPYQFHGEASMIFQVCGLLVNLQNPLLKSKD